MASKRSVGFGSGAKIDGIDTSISIRNYFQTREKRTTPMREVYRSENKKQTTSFLTFIEEYQQLIEAAKPTNERAFRIATETILSDFSEDNPPQWKPKWKGSTLHKWIRGELNDEGFTQASFPLRLDSTEGSGTVLEIAELFGEKEGDETPAMPVVETKLSNTTGIPQNQQKRLERRIKDFKKIAPIPKPENRDNKAPASSPLINMYVSRYLASLIDRSMERSPWPVIEANSMSVEKFDADYGNYRNTLEILSTSAGQDGDAEIDRIFGFMSMNSSVYEGVATTGMVQSMYSSMSKASKEAFEQEMIAVIENYPINKRVDLITSGADFPNSVIIMQPIVAEAGIGLMELSPEGGNKYAQVFPNKYNGEVSEANSDEYPQIKVPVGSTLQAAPIALAQFLEGDELDDFTEIITESFDLYDEPISPLLAAITTNFVLEGIEGNDVVISLILDFDEVSFDEEDTEEGEDTEEDEGIESVTFRLPNAKTFFRRGHASYDTKKLKDLVNSIIPEGATWEEEVPYDTSFKTKGDGLGLYLVEEFPDDAIDSDAIPYFSVVGEIITQTLIEAMIPISRKENRGGIYSLTAGLIGTTSEPGLATYHAHLHYLKMLEQAASTISSNISNKGQVLESRTLTMESYTKDPSKLMIYWLLMEKQYIDIGELDSEGFPMFFTVPQDKSGIERSEAKMMNIISILFLTYYRVAFHQISLMNRSRNSLTKLWEKLINNANNDAPEPQRFAAMIRLLNEEGALEIPPWMPILPEELMGEERSKVGVGDYIKWAFGNDPVNPENFAEVSAAYHASKAISYYKPGEYNEMVDNFIQAVEKDNGYAYLIAVLMAQKDNISDRNPYRKEPLAVSVEELIGLPIAELSEKISQMVGEP